MAQPMRQNDQYQGNHEMHFNEQHHQTMINAYVVTDADHVTVLRNAKRNVPANHKKKKELLKDLYRMRREILDATSVLEFSCNFTGGNWHEKVNLISNFY
jgi:hypothetical protein